jgi:hypothetical protein
MYILIKSKMHLWFFLLLLFAEHLGGSASLSYIFGYLHYFFFTSKLLDFCANYFQIEKNNGNALVFVILRNQAEIRKQLI